MVIVFVLLALAVLVTANVYLWRRLFRDTTSGPGRVRRAGAVLIAGGWILAVAALVGERTGAPFWLQRTLAWPGFLWMALSVYLLLALLAGEAVRPLLRRFLRKRAAADTPVARPEPETVPAGAPAPRQPDPEDGAPPPPDPSRRLFVSRVVAGTAAAVAVGTVGQGTYGVLRGPRVKRVTVPLARLPRRAHGYRIAVVSDIHLGPVLGRGFAQRVVDTINATQPDLIAVVGDLVDGSVKDLGPAAAPLAGLKAREGSFFVTGNHEYFSGAEQWVEEVRRLGLDPLENARTELPWFDLAGVNDIAGESEGHGPDFARALDDRDTTRACVLMAHQPVQIHDAVRHGVDLQLSGHTHGGQLWPGSLLAAAANPTVAGLERYGDTQLYVSRGAGAWGPPTRVGAPSDITVVELASTDA
ncbi:metallophosphoesterase [Streptomyces asoensis]|uniref:Membrane protein n=1 Tax=Streptomyces asoensis TaxID=249586 RepID=A0ABQ3S4U8_9ACTN|nr:metallophosphoesterase [Streptomyces asoensis]GGQ59473.1 membrane protein [Streptomyces asoensis]GHI62957.1 membrane protein [Streptomyces asoensis]